LPLLGIEAILILLPHRIGALLGHGLVSRARRERTPDRTDPTVAIMDLRIVAREPIGTIGIALEIDVFVHCFWSFKGERSQSKSIHFLLSGVVLVCHALSREKCA